MLIIEILVYYYLVLLTIIDYTIELVGNVFHNLGIFRIRNYAQIPDDLTKRVVVITGGSNGIGLITAKEVAKRGANVVIATLIDSERIEEFDEIDNGKIDVIEMDLSSFKSVQNAVSLIRERYEKIDVLINNAGVMASPERKTVEGFEYQFGTNYLGHFLFTMLLLDRIKMSSNARIVNLSSCNYKMGRVYFENLNMEGIYTPMDAYNRSKLCCLYFTQQLAKRLHSTNVKVYAVHPGIVRTNIANNLSKRLMYASTFFELCFLDAYLGAQTTLYCAFDKRVDNQTGFYYE
ncbi:hypothetical protein RDWZM_006244 [Blomia tropicalis]|uniref:Uncharacterized protein n=1 Tax=Blomia tropicalis TaxID=40697 RepID=A0A9Q0M7H3_BLOTA|nr:hypothetical protein RDWZM_006244 [Blomia tropicalis]